MRTFWMQSHCKNIQNFFTVALHPESFHDYEKKQDRYTSSGLRLELKNKLGFFNFKGGGEIGQLIV